MDQLDGFNPLLFQDVAAHATDQVEPIGFTRSGQQLRHGHRFFTHAEELHKAGIEADKVAG
ncbi:hypothetical protein D3C78_1692460 [compost metagenome]